MRIERFILASLVLLSLSACTYWRNMNAKQDFVDSSKEYNKMVRWENPEQAGLAYADKSICDQFLVRAKTAKDVKIVDYRVKSLDYQDGRNEATAKVEIDYYIPPSITVKTLEDIQKWSYIEEDGKRFWRLKSLFPEFK